VVITRTPFRISFFGGGTDYPAWFRENGGAVLATTIDKYCYITCRHLPPFFEHKHRIVYSQVENVSRTEDIRHPAVRAVLSCSALEKRAGLEIHHDGDLPARAGLGSSSSFTVGLLKAVYALEGRMIDPEDLARQAIHLEQNVMNENVGVQDQISAAFGGFNKITIKNDGAFAVEPVVIKRDRLEDLQNHLMLFFTGLSRWASEIAKSKIDNLGKKEAEVKAIGAMVGEGLHILQSSAPMDEFGELLDESWRLKRTLSERVSSNEIDGMYEAAKSAGATGGKILGAGGGGFLLIFAKPEFQATIKSKLAKLVHVPFLFERGGSQVALYQPNGL
jgi:D-glycero-alpha-D-manno-heptose-7-phosphate kinase